MEPATNTFFAIQLRPGETPHQVAALFIQTASQVKLLFRRLDTLNILDFAGKRFVRFRSDVINPFPILDRLLASGRATISAAPGAYLLRTPTGKPGPVSFLPMHTVPNPSHFRQYHGTRTAEWAEQFQAA